MTVKNKGMLEMWVTWQQYTSTSGSVVWWCQQQESYESYVLGYQAWQQQLWQLAVAARIAVSMVSWQCSQVVPARIGDRSCGMVLARIPGSGIAVLRPCWVVRDCCILILQALLAMIAVSSLSLGWQLQPSYQWQQQQPYFRCVQSP